MTGKSKSKSQKEKPKAEKVQSEPKVVEVIKEVEKPLNLAEKSPTELAKLEEQIEAQKINNHLKSEKKRIEKVKCPVCNTNLKLDPEKYMKQGTIKEDIECKKCEKLITVTIGYDSDPASSTAKIEIKPGHYTWEVKKPSEWKDKHVLRWAEEEMEKLENNQSSLNPNEQKLFRLLYLGLKKQKIIK